MSGRQPIDFWCSVGSTYSSLSIARVAGIARASGVEFRWRDACRMVCTSRPPEPAKQRTPARRSPAARTAVRSSLAVDAVSPWSSRHPTRSASSVVACGEKSRNRLTCRRWLSVQSSPEPAVRPRLRSNNPLARLLPLRPQPTPAVQRRPFPGAAAGLQLPRAHQRHPALGIFGAPSFAVDRELFWAGGRAELAHERAGGAGRFSGARSSGDYFLRPASILLT